VSGPQRLSSILGRWKPAHYAGDGDPSAIVGAVWPDAVGPDVARRTRPGKLRDGVLTVYTAGSTWSHQLTFLAPAIVAELNALSPSAGVQRLRFVVASGATKAHLDGLARPSAARGREAGRVRAGDTPAVDDDAENAEDIVARLRRRQQALDRRREREGWRRCTYCGAWRNPANNAGVADDACAVCAEEARSAADNRIEHILTSAPWLRQGAVASHIADADDAAYDRVRRRMLSRWEEQIFLARRRLRRNELHATDRVVAWSYLMLRTGMQQHVIGRAVVADALGEDWADTLVGPASARHREAPAADFKKPEKTAARVFTRRTNT
jgi:hypothetical protein